MKKRLFSIPSPVNPRLDNRIVDPKSFRKINHAARNASNCEHNIAGRISRLLFLCRPPAVSRFVVSIFVWPSVNAFAFWFYTHIFKKLLKRFTPSCRDGNSSTSVKMKVGVFRILAAVNHFQPDIVDWRFAHAVSAAAVSSQFVLKAAARFLSRLQSRIAYNPLNSTVAFAKELSPVLTRWKNFAFNFRNNDESCVPFPDDGYFCRHSIGAFFALFSGACPALTGTRCDYQPYYGGVN